MKTQNMILGILMFASSAFAGGCPKPNEYAASAFETIRSGGDLAAYLERYTVGRTAKNEDCEDMYHLAIRTRNEKARKVLDRIGYGPQTDTDVKDNKYYEYAVRYGSISLIQEMGSKFEPDNLDFYERHFAAKWAGSGNTIAVIDWLISKTKLTADDFFYSAITNNSRDVIEQLIRRGADIRNESVLQGALRRVYQKPSETPVLEMLIRAGAAVTPAIIQFASYDNAPAELEILRLAGGHYPQSALNNATGRGNTKAMKYFVGIGLSLDAVPGGALHNAAKSGKLEAVKFVVESGADVNALSSYGFPPLSYAHEDKILDYLLSKGASLDLYNIHGKTSFHSAVSSLNLDDVKWFLKNGVKADQRTKDGIPALHLVVENLSSNGEEALKVIELLISAGVKIDAKDQDGMTVLMRVAMTQGDHIGRAIQFLLSQGANKKISVRQGRKRKTAYDLYKENRPYYKFEESIAKLLE
jgi:ankyrin repeat protein